MDALQTTEVLGTGGPGVAAVQEVAEVVGIQTVRIDSAAVAGASDLTMIVGQMMTGQVVGENQTAPHPLVAAHHLTVAVAHRPLVAAHHPSVVGRGKLHKIPKQCSKLQF
jgi:hypothetical protein